MAIFRGLSSDVPNDPGPLERALRDYAKLIRPWAKSVAGFMLADVDRRNLKAWKAHGNDLGVGLRNVITSTPVGQVYLGLLDEQVRLITSIPLESAERVHDIVREEMPRATRSATIAAGLAEAENIPLWRAKLIARTEVSRSSVALTQARAQAIGSEGYIWRTVGDSDVRPDHKKMEGKYVRWDKPPSFKNEPTLGPYHAGCGPNCRCYPEPVLPEF